MTQMILDEARDKKITVIVASLPSHQQRNAGVPAGLLEQVRLQLRVEELIRSALVDQDRRTLPAQPGNQQRRVVVGPGTAVAAEIAAQRFLTPGTSGR